jgi:predicted metalloprotease
LPSRSRRSLRTLVAALLLVLLTLTPAAAAAQAQTPDPKLVELLGFVDDSVATFWADVFATSELGYTPPTTHLVGEPLSHSCGDQPATPEDPPFYCPLDEAVVMTEQALMLAKESSAQINQDGDFALAYMMAHEHAHHVQSLLGIYDNVIERAELGEPLSELSRMFELQADCLAGVWANAVYQQGIVEPGDIEEAQNLTVWLGDDRLAPSHPELWDHGTSQERYDWFTQGMQTGDPVLCDTGI